MKKLLWIVIVVLALGGAGYGAVRARVVHVTWPPRALKAYQQHQTVAPLTAANSTLVTESKITSNLAGTGHFIALTLVFRVRNTALAQAGGQPNNVTGGTGAPALDARIKADVTLLCRSTHYAQVQTPAGDAVFRRRLDQILVRIFGAHQVGQVYLPSFITQ